MHYSINFYENFYKIELPEFSNWLDYCLSIAPTWQKCYLACDGNSVSSQKVIHNWCL